MAVKGTFSGKLLLRAMHLTFYGVLMTSSISWGTLPNPCRAQRGLRGHGRREEDGGRGLPGGLDQQDGGSAQPRGGAVLKAF